MGNEEISRLTRQCENMAYGPARTALALRVKALADQEGTPWNRLVSRYDLACSYVMSDDSAKALPVCAEYFQLLEEHPDITPRNPIFTLYLAERCAAIPLDLPQIPKAQCKALLDQFGTYSKRYQRGVQWFHQAEFRYYRTMGELEEARRCFERFRREKPDPDQTCAACNLGTEVCALLDLDRREEALEAAGPLLTGDCKCQHGAEPSRTLTTLLLDELDRGLWEAAAGHAAQLSRMGFQDRGDLWSLSAVLLWRAGAEPGRSLRLLEKGAAWSMGRWNQDDLFHFYWSAWALLRRLGVKRKSVRLELPRRFPLWREDGQYEIAALAEWFHTQAADIARKFDRRSGTDQYTRPLRRWEEQIAREL